MREDAMNLTTRAIGAAVLFLIGSFFGIPEPATGQIKRVEKVERSRITFQGQLHHKKYSWKFEPDATIDQDIRVQVNINLRSGSFEKGGIHLFLETSTHLSPGIIRNTWNLGSESLYQGEKLTEFIQQIDELYSTPLDGAQRLELDLVQEMQNTPEGMVKPPERTLFGLRKNERGYFIYHRDYQINKQRGLSVVGYQSQGWYQIDLVAFRETLAQAAKAANLKVPDPPPAMQKAIASMDSDKVWKFGNTKP
ncbi:hypothetical protein N9231_05890 [Saprospiraceae bacterium]|nr:hypothetical protein [Saprospiraceae bacterium]